MPAHAHEFVYARGDTYVNLISMFVGFACACKTCVCLSPSVHQSLHENNVHSYTFSWQAEALRMLAGETRRRRFTHHLRVDKKHIDALEVGQRVVCLFVGVCTECGHTHYAGRVHMCMSSRCVGVFACYCDYASIRFLSSSRSMRMRVYVCFMYVCVFVCICIYIHLHIYTFTF